MINVLQNENDKEWIRRRQMRLVQVRNQSNDIAKQLRVRVSNEEQERKIKKENEVEGKLELWKIKKLRDLNEVYRDAVSCIGTAHKLAVEDLDGDGIREEKKKVYACRAKKRGESALEHALRVKREAIEKKLIPVQRKIITRQIEDIRSSLIRSISDQKAIKLRNVSPKRDYNPKLFEGLYGKEKSNCRNISRQEENFEKIGRKTILSSSHDHVWNGQSSSEKRKHCKKMQSTKIVSDSPGRAKTKSNPEAAKSSIMSCPEGEKKIWVNLGAVEAITEFEEDEAGKNSVAGEVQEGKNSVAGEVQEGKKGSEKEKEPRKKIVKIECKRHVPPKRETENGVECHGYSLRHKCNLKGDASSVRRIDEDAEPDPTELARQEEEKFEAERREKKCKMLAAAERGHKAIEKEKITRNYNELLAKLEKLSTKEKIIKTYCHIPPPHMFMSDERRQEKSLRKQRIMDSKFEKIYYETVGENPNSDLEMGRCARGSVQSDEHELPTKLDFGESERNPKTNSPASSSLGSDSRHRNHSVPVERVTIEKTASSLRFERTKVNKREVALSDLDRLLKKTRQLREDSHRFEHPPSECRLIASLGDRQIEKLGEKEKVPTEESVSPTLQSDYSELGKSVSLSSCEGHHLVSEFLKKEEMKKSNELKKETITDLGMGDLGRDLKGIRTETIAWPVHQVTTNANFPDEFCARSSTTSYREVPAQILPKRINSMLKVLVQLKEREGRSIVADELIVKMEETLDALIREAERNNVTLNREDCQEFQFNPQLNYYISKLLTMSRERVANLSVTSESEISIQRGEEGESCGSGGRPGPMVTPENKYLKQMNKYSKCSNVKRARELERAVMKWKRILENSSKKCPPSGEGCEDPSFAAEEEEDDDEDQVEEEEEKEEDEDEDEEEEEEVEVEVGNGICFQRATTPEYDFNYFDKFEEVSKKCTECISGLSNVLASVRKDVVRGGMNSAEKNGGCGGSVGVTNRNSLAGSECQRVLRQECPRSKSPRSGERTQSCERPGSRQTTQRVMEKADRRGRECKQSENESEDTLPDVMNVLLEKGILTSPFNWNPPEREDQQPSGHCMFIRKRKQPRKTSGFQCKVTCRGACQSLPFATYKDETQNMAAAPVDPEAMREIRKKLEQIPMKYLDAQYGLYSPIPMPRPFPTTPVDDSSFMRRNFGQPLFGLPIKEPDPETIKPRQLHFRIHRKDRPNSEPKITDSCGSQSDRPNSGGGSQRRPRSSPSGRQNACSPGNRTPQGSTNVFEDSLEPATASKPPPRGLDNKYFRPATPSPDAQQNNTFSVQQNPYAKRPSLGLDNKYFRPATPSPEKQTGATCAVEPEPCAKPPPRGLDNKYFRPATPSPEKQTGATCAVEPEPCAKPPPRGLDNKYFRPATPSPEKQTGATCAVEPEPCGKPPPRGLDNKYFRPATPSPEKQTGATCAVEPEPCAKPPPRGLDKYFRPATPSPETQTGGACAAESGTHSKNMIGLNKYFQSDTPTRPLTSNWGAEAQPCSKPQQSGLDNRYFRPASASPRQKSDHDTFTSDEDAARQWSSDPCSFADFNEGGPCGTERNDWNRRPPISCAGACAVHCNPNNQQSDPYSRYHPPGRDRCSSRSLGGLTYTISDVAGFANDQFSAGRQPQGGCQHREGKNFDEDEDCGNPGQYCNLDWAENFL